MPRPVKNHNDKRCKPASERFWRHVNKATESGCWEWVGFKNNYGYGQFWADNRMVYAHRFSYELHHGKLCDGLFACHRCDNPKCVNPDHLFSGSAKENADDCSKKGRRPKSRGRFTDKIERLIRKECEAGVRQPTIAKEFNISIKTVQRIASGMTYTQLAQKRARDRVS